MIVSLANALDRFLGRFTMYRVATSCLIALAVVAFAARLLGGLSDIIFGLDSMIIALVVLVGASVLSSRLLALLFRTRAHTESAIITGLILWFLYWPPPDAGRLAWLVAPAVLASLSKYLLAYRGRHIFNPAAAGVILTVIVQELFSMDQGQSLFTTWWVGSEVMLPFVAVAALVVLLRCRRLMVGITFVVVSTALLTIGLMGSDYELGPAIRQVLTSFPVVFAAGFMISEPLTLPPRRRQQWLIAALAGALFALPLFFSGALNQPLDVGIFDGTQELALLAANALAFVLGRRVGVRFMVARREEINPGVVELALTPKEPLHFKAGQYLELQIPHSGADGRGMRRMLSITSAPTEHEVRLAVRISPTAASVSSFKQALLALEPGDRVSATGTWGDFTAPAADVPILLVAGGIGITPFLSYLAAASRSDHSAAQAPDWILVYGVTDGDDVPFRERLEASGVRVVLVSPEPPKSLPEGWAHLPGDRIEVSTLPTVIDDLAAREAYVSGPPVMVDTVSNALRGKCRAVHTDHFDGY